MPRRRQRGIGRGEQLRPGTAGRIPDAQGGPHDATEEFLARVERLGGARQDGRHPIGILHEMDGPGSVEKSARQA